MATLIRGDALVNMVSLDDSLDFNPERGECCTAANFRINLGGTPCDVWNKSATRIFVNDFLREHPDYPSNNQVVRMMVQKKTSAAIKSLIQEYRRKDIQGPSKLAAQKLRNRRERKRTVCAPILDRFSLLLTNSYQLYHRRRDISFFYPGLESQRPKLEQLGVAGMSSDEEETNGDGIKQYRILAPQWRSSLVGGWLHYFDSLYNRARRDGAFTTDRGSAPRIRLNARKRSKNKKFVAGLPLNAYSESWLDQQVDIDNVVQPGPEVSWMHEPTIVE